MQSNLCLGAFKGRHLLQCNIISLVLQALAQHELLSVPFLDYVVAILNQSPGIKDEGEKIDAGDSVSHSHRFNQLPQAAIVAMAAFLRYFMLQNHFSNGWLDDPV